MSSPVGSRLAKTTSRAAKLGALSIAVAALASVGLLWRSSQLWLESSRGYLVAADNMERARQTAGSAFVVSIRPPTSNTETDRQQWIERLDSASLAARDAAEGASSVAGIPSQAPPEALRARLQAYRSAIDDLDRLGKESVQEERLAAGDQSRLGTAFAHAEQLASQTQEAIRFGLFEAINGRAHPPIWSLALWMAVPVVALLLVLGSARRERGFSRELASTVALKSR